MELFYDFGFLGKVVFFELVVVVWEELEKCFVFYFNWMVVECCVIGVEDGIIIMNVLDDIVFSLVLLIKDFYVFYN